MPKRIDNLDVKIAMEFMRAARWYPTPRTYREAIDYTFKILPWTREAIENYLGGKIGYSLTAGRGLRLVNMIACTGIEKRYNAGLHKNSDKVRLLFNLNHKILDEDSVVSRDEYLVRWIESSRLVMPPDPNDLRKFPDSMVVAAMKRQNGACAYCRRIFEEDRRPVGDHKRPYSKGGKTTDENCAASCDECNTAKGDMLLEDFMKSAYMAKFLKKSYDKGRRHLLEAGIFNEP